MELGALLRDAAIAAGGKWADTPAAMLESTLREFERRRSTRCAPLVAQARQNGRRFTAPRSAWVRPNVICSVWCQTPLQVQHSLYALLCMAG